MNDYPDHIVIAKISSLLYGFNQLLEYVIDLIIVVQFFKDLNFEFICVALEFLIFPVSDANYFEFSKTCVFSLEYVIIEIEIVLWFWRLRWFSSWFLWSLCILHLKWSVSPWFCRLLCNFILKWVAVKQASPHGY